MVTFARYAWVVIHSLISNWFRPAFSSSYTRVPFQICLAFNVNIFFQLIMNYGTNNIQYQIGKVMHACVYAHVYSWIGHYWIKYILIMWGALVLPLNMKTIVYAKDVSLINGKPCKQVKRKMWQHNPSTHNMTRCLLG